jgi:1-acyl-sn-glycerol-3-phosphate acyltransferase
MRLARSIWRGLRVTEHLASGALIGLYVSLASRLRARPEWVPGVTRWWHGRLCRALGVRVQVSGAVAERCLLVANHVSWLDVPALGAQAELAFLSKAEVRRWPLVGWMASLAGTLFIERGANQVGLVAREIAIAVAAGRSLVIFPEGTTSDGRQVRRFHPRLFSAVQQPGLGIQPVAIGYRRGGCMTPDLSVPYIDDDTLLANLLRVLQHPDLVVSIELLPPLWPGDGDHRRRLAERTRGAIAGALGLDQPGPARAWRDTDEVVCPDQADQVGWGPAADARSSAP